MPRRLPPHARPHCLLAQTDLIVAAAATGRIVNIKRGPFADIGTMVRAGGVLRRAPP
jgi:3-deoxy-D-manno-octulosonic acid (KDO) 8-phosphate synthase